MREFVSMIGLVFVAELADKTQLTILGLSAGDRNPWLVFIAGSVGLVLSTALAVLIGDGLNRYVPAEYLNYAVGILFVGLGIWFLITPVIEP